MVAIEIGVLVLAIVGLLFFRQILGSIKLLAMNAVGGIIVLLIAEWIGFGIELTPLTVAITAIAGIPGALLILLLAYGGFAFTPEAGAGSVFVEQATEFLDRIINEMQEFTG